VTGIEAELLLVGLLAMLEPATLGSSVLTLVLGERPLRTGSWFYVGGLGATLAVGVIAAFALGSAAASRTSTPKTWVSVLGIVAGLLLLAYVIRAVRRPVDPKAAAANIERMEKVASYPASRIVVAGAVLANAGVFMVIALKDISQLNPSAIQYLLNWLAFSLVSLLPLSLALVMLRAAPRRTAPALAVAHGWIERHARTVALIIAVALAASLLRNGISGLSK
jgi:Sap, sulfolipid-1-addressing protein